MNTIILFFACFFCASQLFVHCADSIWPVFNLYTRSNPNTPVKVTDAKGLLSTPNFQPNRKSYFIIHGYFGFSGLSYLKDIRNALLNKEDANIFAVDWSSASSNFLYTVSAKNAKECGRRLGKLIIESQIDPMKVHCIGHSLGSHACGFAGKTIKIGRITGLDPAGPGFKTASPNQRLDKNDAYYVDIIHGDSKLGIQIPIGHKDFYPNGGAVQCARTSPRDCTSHIRPVNYFTESIKNTICSFRAFKCQNYGKYTAALCKTNPFAQMGLSSVNNTENGTFYLDTNKYGNGQNVPFCKE